MFDGVHLEQLISSHAVKRFFYRLPREVAPALNAVLQTMFAGRLHIKVAYSRLKTRTHCFFWPISSLRHRLLDFAGRIVRRSRRWVLQIPERVYAALRLDRAWRRVHHAPVWLC